jgi:hypothetical protein
MSSGGKKRAAPVANGAAAVDPSDDDDVVDVTDEYAERKKSAAGGSVDVTLCDLEADDWLHSMEMERQYRKKAQTMLLTCWEHRAEYPPEPPSDPFASPSMGAIIWLANDAFRFPPRSR